MIYSYLIFTYIKCAFRPSIDVTNSYFRCRASQDCPAFIIEYDEEACYRLDTNTEDNRYQCEELRRNVRVIITMSVMVKL